MIDHTGVSVKDFDKSVAWYEKAFAPLGYKLLMKFEGAAGFGDGKPSFWVRAGAPHDKSHLAFVAKGRAQVRAFHEAAIAAGGTDNGAPGVRPNYHDNYYAAFVRDLDGNNIEAVCHEAFLG